MTWATCCDIAVEFSVVAKWFSGLRRCDYIYCKTLFFRRILISRFPYVENLPRFNLADFPVNFVNKFVFCFFWCL